MMPTETAYLNELSAEIVGPVTIESITAAHERRRVFWAEMLNAKTARAQQARLIMTASVWTKINQQHAIKLVMARCAEVSDE